MKKSSWMEKKLGVPGVLFQKKRSNYLLLKCSKTKKLITIMKAVKIINKIKQPNLKINSYTLKGFFLKFFTDEIYTFH